MNNPAEELEEAALLKERVKAFMGGVQVASLALRAVLARKCDVGILQEVTARGIFEAVGLEMEEGLRQDEKGTPDDGDSV